MSEHRTPFTTHNQVKVNSQYDHHPDKRGTFWAFECMLLDLDSFSLQTLKKKKGPNMSYSLQDLENILSTERICIGIVEPKSVQVVKALFMSKAGAASLSFTVD